MYAGTARAQPGVEALRIPLTPLRRFHGSAANGEPCTPSCPPAGWGAGKFPAVLCVLFPAVSHLSSVGSI